MNKSQKNCLKQFTKKAKQLIGKNIQDIIIYGSAARNETQCDSDIDVIVIVKNNPFRHQMTLAQLAFDILLETGEYISVQTMKPKDLMRDTIFLHNVRNEAIHIQ
jgi:predicted nucleotidyltransferase